MKQKCMQCHKNMGEIEPLEDKSITHGLCTQCFENFRKQKKETKEQPCPEPDEGVEMQPLGVIAFIFSLISLKEQKQIISATLLSNISQQVENLPLDEALKKGVEMIQEFCDKQKKHFIAGYEKNMKIKNMIEKNEAKVH